MKKNKRIYTMILNAMLIAITLIATILITIPIGSAGGYINFGDAIIIVTSILFGPINGAIVGSIGASIGDLIIYPAYAPFTLIIKGIEGFLIGYIFHKLKGKFLMKSFISSLIGVVWMIGGYFLTSLFFYDGNFYAALLEIPFNAIQAIICLIIGCFIAFTLYKIKKNKSE